MIIAIKLVIIGLPTVIHDYIRFSVHLSQLVLHLLFPVHLYSYAFFLPIYFLSTRHDGADHKVSWKVIPYSEPWRTTTIMHVIRALLINQFYSNYACILSWLLMMSCYFIICFAVYACVCIPIGRFLGYCQTFSPTLPYCWIFCSEMYTFKTITIACYSLCTISTTLTHT